MWTDLGLQQLAAWGIPLQAAEGFGLFEVADASEVYPDFGRGEPAIVIPYWWPNGEPQTFTRDGEELSFCRVRYLRSRAKLGFTKQREQRYDQPARSGIHVYYPPGGDWERKAADPEEPVIITEGEAKAMVGQLHNLPVIALGGVFNFALASGEGLVDGLAVVKWNGRKTFVCFDSDRASNNGIMTAEARLVQELQSNRGALCSLIELPADGPKKVGLDDFLNKYGYDAFMLLLKSSVSLGVVDAKVIALNQHCAWIESEGMVFDLDERKFIRKENFTNGSRFSTVHHWMQGGVKRTGPKQVFIAPMWLKHQHAQRYGEVLFRPGLGQAVEGMTGKPALNMWDGWRAEYGATSTDRRIAAWLELTAFLCRNMEPQDRDFLVKLLAYKAQNPMSKPALSPVFIGDQGCGKSLWCECVTKAFNPYSDFLNSDAFGSQFNSWVEHAIIAVVNEANAQHIKQYGEKIKSLISDKTQPLRDLYRPMRQVESYTMYILTANDRAVGSFSADDRRMIVIDCPPKMTDAHGVALYNYLGSQHGTWVAEHGPQALLGWLLEYDLQGWVPPHDAPKTAEKFAAYREGLSPIQELAHRMRETQGENAVESLLAAATAWAENSVTASNPAVSGMAQATIQGLKHMTIRPWYTPAELSLIFPYVVAQILNSRFDQRAGPGALAKELRNNGINYLKSRDDPRGFLWKGQYHQFLLVSDMDDFRFGLTQAQFEQYMGEFRAYGQRRR